MPFQPGNEYAKKHGFQPGNVLARGHGFGRPRVIPQTDEELILLGEDLLKWCEEDPLNNITFPLFHTTRGILRKEWRLIIQHDVFRTYYEMAQSLLGRNFVNGNIQSSIAHRFIRLYHQDVKEDEDEVASAKNKAVSSINSNANCAELLEETVKGMIKQPD